MYIIKHDLLMKIIYPSMSECKSKIDYTKVNSWTGVDTLNVSSLERVREQVSENQHCHENIMLCRRTGIGKLALSSPCMFYLKFNIVIKVNAAWVCKYGKSTL